MGNTKFQKFIFTLMMCFGMVLCMTVYNMILNDGLNSSLLSNLFKDFWFGFIVALFLDVFVVSKLAKPLAFKIVKPTENTHPLKIVIAISTCMVIGMVLLMSLYGSIVVAGFNLEAIKIYPYCIARNFIVALPLNLLIISPLVRFSFGKVFAIN
ncbi:TPA: DUF2798 domain-containing protein [Clostridium perfringens]